MTPDSSSHNRLAKLGSISAITIALGIVSACFGMVGVLGHTSVDYIVVNNTSEDLLTWGMNGDCASLADDRDDYFFEEVVRAHSRLEYSDYGPFVPPDCIHVAATDRRLVLVSTYKSGKVVTVDEPLAPTGEPLPAQHYLPRRSAMEYWVTEAERTIRIFEFGVLLLGVGVLGLIAWGTGQVWSLVRKT